MNNIPHQLFIVINGFTYPFVDRTIKSLSVLLIVCLVSLTTACQLTPATVNTSDNYSLYYLTLKKLTAQEILAEEKHLTAPINNKSPDDKVLNQGRLIILYSLPSATLHNPYKAKRLLNEYLLSSNNNTKDNFAFIMLLRDQLNSQLHLLANHKANKEACKKESNEHHLLIEHLQHQLKLLKQIDKNINERG